MGWWVVGKEEAPQPQRPQFEQQNAAHIRTKFLPGDSCGEVLVVLGPCCSCCRFVYRFQATTTTLLQECSKHIESPEPTLYPSLFPLPNKPKNLEWMAHRHCSVGVFTHFKCQFCREAHKMADFPQHQWWSWKSKIVPKSSWNTPV